MKFEKIRQLYRSTEINMVDPEFFKKIYQGAITRIEKIDDKALEYAFERESKRGVLISHFSLYSENNASFIRLYGNNAINCGKIEVEYMDTKGFLIGIGFEEDAPVFIAWTDAFKKENAKKISENNLI